MNIHSERGVRMAKKMVPHGYMIDQDQYKKLRRLAFDQGITMSKFVRDALEQHIKNLKKQTKRGK
jgi:predicted DNA-binding protein